MKSKAYAKHFLMLFVLMTLLFFVNISLGSVSIPFKDILSILFGGNINRESWEIIVLNFRLPKSITAVLVGSGLSICGLLMQTLFRNPLAGPYVIGISSGASLGAAVLILGSSIFGNFLTYNSFSNWALPIASSTGAFLVLASVIVVSNKVRNTMSILIIGLMFGSLSSAIINILAYFSEASKIQKFLFWGYGSLGNLSWNELFVFACFYFVAIFATIIIIKPLNSFLLGENYAKSLGVNVLKNRNIILLITAILTGVITAFSGLIAFVGLAVPHISKIIFYNSNHKVLIPATAIIGAIVLLICDSIAQLPTSKFTLPLNAVTSLFGAPVVIWLLVRKKRTFV